MRPTESSRSIQMNDDLAEKQSRRNSGALSAPRNAPLTVVAESLRNQDLSGSNSSLSRDQGGAPVLANFEQWMKLVKDNKINASNSWNFALIDYFHDMRLLRDGDGINFQRASYTLDGCVKIYTSRIDSVASETGKLLSGLAESNKKALENDDDQSDNELEDGGDGGDNQKKKRRRKPRAESNLAQSFEELRAKKLDLELSIDPLFRKMCADFDEGGAKGLLLNSLFIDRTGRVVFDGEVEGEDAEDEDGEHSKAEIMDQESSASETDVNTIDLAALKERYLPDLSILDTLSVCPSLNSLNSALSDPALFSSSFVKEIEKTTEQEGLMAGDGEGFDDGFNDDDDLGIDLPMEDDGEFGHTEVSYQTLDGATTGRAVTVNDTSYSQDLMSYFDETLRKNWAGPEHWKIQKLKSTSLLSSDTTYEPKKKPEKEKEVFYIDFLSDEYEVDEQLLFAPGGSTINIPKTQWKSKTRNLLPDDKHFSSKNLIRLFLKPKGNVLNFFGAGTGGTGDVNTDVEVDENFWANQYENSHIQEQGESAGGANNEYDANFFHDNDDIGQDTGVDFPDNDHDDYDSIGDSGDLLQAARRARPEYVNYAKTAKKVNVKVLKDNIWDALSIKMDHPPVDEAGQPVQEDNSPTGDHEGAHEERKFTEVVQDLKKVYPAQQMADISTSFCFICVLHLANEKGLVIEGTPDYGDLTIKQDPDAKPIQVDA